MWLKNSNNFINICIICDANQDMDSFSGDHLNSPCMQLNTHPSNEGKKKKAKTLGRVVCKAPPDIRCESLTGKDIWFWFSYLHLGNFYSICCSLISVES